MEHNDLEALNEKLIEKYREIEKNEQSCEEFETSDAEIVIVAYGISSRVALGAIEMLRARGIKAGLVRPKMVWPFPKNALEKLSREERVKAFVSLELSAGQMIEDVELATRCRKPVRLCNRMGGNIPSCGEVCEAVEKVWNEVSK